jgi:hypothetical protein
MKDLDISDFVEILQPDKSVMEFFAFYKSPKDQPEQTEGESQESLLIDLMLMVDQDNSNEDILSKFIIKRK